MEQCWGTRSTDQCKAVQLEQKSSLCTCEVHAVDLLGSYADALIEAACTRPVWPAIPTGEALRADTEGCVLPKCYVFLFLKEKSHPIYDAISLGLS